MRFIRRLGEKGTCIVVEVLNGKLPNSFSVGSNIRDFVLNFSCYKEMFAKRIAKVIGVEDPSEIRVNLHEIEK